MSKTFGNSKNNRNDYSFDLDTDIWTLNSKLIDETINSHSNTLDSSVNKTIDCLSNLSTPQISEEYDQKKNIKKKLDE